MDVTQGRIWRTVWISEFSLVWNQHPLKRICRGVVAFYLLSTLLGPSDHVRGRGLFKVCACFTLLLFSFRCLTLYIVVSTTIRSEEKIHLFYDVLNIAFLSGLPTDYYGRIGIFLQKSLIFWNFWKWYFHIIRQSKRTLPDSTCICNVLTELVWTDIVKTTKANSKYTSPSYVYGNLEFRAWELYVWPK